MQRRYKWLLGGIAVILLAAGIDGAGEDGRETAPPAAVASQAPSPSGKASSIPKSTSSARPAKPSPSATPWTAPADGKWPDDYSYDDVSFGKMTKQSKFSDYIFGINSPPALSTENGGKTVTITSTLVVKRVSDKWPGEPVEKDLQLMWEPGERTEANRYDESWGTYIDMSCNPVVLTSGQTGRCVLTFKDAPASEVKNCYWHTREVRLGTWPSQKAAR